MDIGQRVQQVWGMDPDIDRLNVLPNYHPGTGWIAPEFIHDMAKAITMPGHVAQGGMASPGDVTDMALEVGLLGAIGTAPTGALGMGAMRRTPADFVPSKAGSVDLGYFPAEISPGGKPVPIRMFEGLGEGDAIVQRYRRDKERGLIPIETPSPAVGRRHIEDHNLDPKRTNRMPEGAAAYVEDVVTDPDHIYSTPEGGFWVVKETGRDEIAMTGLFPSENGDFFSVGSAMSRGKGKGAKGGGRKLVWSKRPAPLTSPDGNRLDRGSAKPEVNILPGAENSKVFGMYQDYSPQYRAGVEADLSMDHASRMARAQDLGFTVPGRMQGANVTTPVLVNQNDPSLMRSPHAAFNPALRGSRDILAANPNEMAFTGLLDALRDDDAPRYGAFY